MTNRYHISLCCFSLLFVPTQSEACEISFWGRSSPHRILCLSWIVAFLCLINSSDCTHVSVRDCEVSVKVKSGGTRVAVWFHAEWLRYSSGYDVSCRDDCTQPPLSVVSGSVNPPQLHYRILITIRDLVLYSCVVCTEKEEIHGVQYSRGHNCIVT